MKNNLFIVAQIITFNEFKKLFIMNYSMAQVIHLTGIQSHTLRVWEKRYDFIKAKRKESKFRYYTEEQLKLLLNTSILLKNGYRISKISVMNEEELFKNVSAVLNASSDNATENVKGLIFAMLELDEIRFDKVYKLSLRKVGLERTFTEVIFPLFNQIGGLWTYNKASPLHEHFISNLVRQKLLYAIEQLESPSKNAPQIVMFLLEGDHHEISLLLANYLAKKLGWRVLYLGLRLPVKDLDFIINESDTSLFLTTLTIANPNELADLVEVIQNNSDVKLLIAGKDEIAESISKHNQISFLKTPSDLITYLEKSVNS